MRIISGYLRGLKLTSPSGMETRPTLDRVKEAVFSMLMPYINDANVLDVFAGSGALGIEALSRGAKSAVFIDNLNSSIECINTNIKMAKMMDKSTVLKSDALNFLEKCKDNYDIIFIDPPYKNGLYESVLEQIQRNDILASDGFIVLEWDYEFGFTDNLCGFEIFKEKKYGRVGITVLKGRSAE